MTTKIITVFASYDRGPEWETKQEHMEHLRKEGFPVKLVPFLKLEPTFDGQFSLQKINCDEAFYQAFKKNEALSSHFVVHLGIGIRMRLQDFYVGITRYLQERERVVPFIFENVDLNYSYLKENHPDYQITKQILDIVQQNNSQNPHIEKMIFSYKNE